MGGVRHHWCWIPGAIVWLSLTACSGGEPYRYVDIQAHPAMAADQVASRAYEMGYEVGPMQTDPRLGFELYQVKWRTSPPPAQELAPGKEDPGAQKPEGDEAPPDAAPAEGPATAAGGAPVAPPPTDDRAGPEPAPAEDEAPGEAEPIEGVDYELVTVAQVEVHPTDAGSRVAIHSGVLPARALAELLPGDQALTYSVPVSANPIQRTFSWDLVSHVGWQWAIDEGDEGHIVDLDGSLRFGGRLLRFGGGDAVPAPAYSLALLGGLGAGLHPTGFGFRPSIVLSLDRQETAEPIAGEILPTGQRFSLDLSVEGMIGEQARGLVGRLECRHTDTFGIYIAAGYQFAPEASPVISLGVSLGTMPMAAAGAMLLFIQ